MAMAPFAAGPSSSCTPTAFRPNEACRARASLCPPWRSLRTTASPASSSARFISVLSLSTSQKSVRPNNILALDPDFYKIPYVEGVPVGSRLKLWNLPPNCDHAELFEWLNSIENVNCVKLEFTDDPELNAQGVGGFVEFATKSEACMAIVRLDGRKFKGRCIRMDFVEKKPHEREIGGRRNRPRRNYSRSNTDYGYGGSGVQNFEPSGIYDPNMASTAAGRPSPTATMDPPTPPRQYAPLPSHRIYVGNLPWRADENTLNNLFSSHGTVVEARVMRDLRTGNSRGFGFVAMSSEEEMNNAIAALNGILVEGRSIKVNPAAK